jgi:hypothetical protein
MAYSEKISLRATNLTNSVLNNIIYYKIDLQSDKDKIIGTLVLKNEQIIDLNTFLTFAIFEFKYKCVNYVLNCVGENILDSSDPYKIAITGYTVSDKKINPFKVKIPRVIENGSEFIIYSCKI